MYKPLMNAEPETASAPTEGQPTEEAAAESKSSGETSGKQPIDHDAHYAIRRRGEKAEKELQALKDAIKKEKSDKRQAELDEMGTVEKLTAQWEDEKKKMNEDFELKRFNDKTEMKLKNVFADDYFIKGVMDDLMKIESEESREAKIQELAADPSRAHLLRDAQSTTNETTTAPPPFVPPSAGRQGAPAQDLQARLSSTDKAIKRAAYTEYATGIQNGTYTPGQFKA